MADGVISYSGPRGGYGWLIIIDHPQANLYSLYGHLSPSRWRKESGAVEKGELIAYLGDTHENGSSPKYGQIPPHLYFGVRAGQRADYPARGEWRWQAGWVRPCPRGLGWLQPSTVIRAQEIPAGGFQKPDSYFLAAYGVEISLSGVYLFGAACALVYALRANKPVFLPIYGAFMIAIGAFFISGETHSGYVLAAAGTLLAIYGAYRLLRRPTQTPPDMSQAAGR